MGPDDDADRRRADELHVARSDDELGVVARDRPSTACT